jgi:hypothetical protein
VAGRAAHEVWSAPGPLMVLFNDEQCMRVRDWERTHAWFRVTAVPAKSRPWMVVPAPTAMPEATLMMPTLKAEPRMSLRPAICQSDRISRQRAIGRTEAQVDAQTLAARAPPETETVVPTAWLRLPAIFCRSGQMLGHVIKRGEREPGRSRCRRMRQRGRYCC